MATQEGTDPSGHVAVDHAITDTVTVHDATDGRDSAVDDTTMKTDQASEISADMTAPNEHEASLREHNVNAAGDDLSRTLSNASPATKDSITVNTTQQMQPPLVPKRGPGRPRKAKNQNSQEATDNMASATDKAIANDSTRQIQKASVFKRPRGRPRGVMNKGPRQDLASEADSTGKAERPAKLQKKESVRAQSGASGVKSAASPPRRTWHRRHGDNLRALRTRLQASTPDDANHPIVNRLFQPRPNYPPPLFFVPSSQGGFPQGPYTQGLVLQAQIYNTGGNYPGLHLQGPSPQGPSYSGGYLPSQPRHSYPTGSFTMPGTPAGSPSGPCTQGLDRQEAYNTGSLYPGQHHQGSYSPGLNYPSGYYSTSQPRVGYPTGFFAAPGTSGGPYAQGSYPAGSYSAGAFYHQGPPPSARNILPQASPQTGANSSSSRLPNSLATPTQQQSKMAYFYVPDGMDPAALAAGFLPRDGSDLPVFLPPEGRQGLPRRLQSSSEPRARFPDQAEPSSKPANDCNGATDALRPDNEPAPAQAPAQNQQNGAGGSQARSIARTARLPMPIVLLKGQTLHIPPLDNIFETWPRFQVNERMVPFLTEVKETNAPFYNAKSFLPDELKLMVLSDPVSLASQLWPGANAHELRLAIEVTIWSSSWSIFLKKAARDNPLELKRRIDESKRKMRDLVENRGRWPSEELGRRTVGCTGGLRFDDLMASILRILESLSALYNQAQLNIFKEDFCNYMDAMATEQKLLDGGNVPHSGEYSALCVDPAHVPPMLRIVFLDTCDKDRDSRCALYEVLLRQAHRIMRITSDLYSVPEDMEMGNVLNSFILRFDNCNNVESSVRSVIKEIQSARQFFDETAQRKLLAARATGALEEAKCRIKIDLLRQMCAGHRMWCLANKRHSMYTYIQDDGIVRVPLPRLSEGNQGGKSTA